MTPKAGELQVLKRMASVPSQFPINNLTVCSNAVCRNCKCNLVSRVEGSAMISQKLRILVVSFAAFVSLFVAQRPAAAQTWSNCYGYRRAITIDHTKVPNTDQSNF